MAMFGLGSHCDKHICFNHGSEITMLFLQDQRTSKHNHNLVIFLRQLHLELPGELPLSQAHDLCVAVENAIHDRYPNAEVLVHADPLEVAPPKR